MTKKNNLFNGASYGEVIDGSPTAVTHRKAEFVRLALRKNGATGEEMRVAMNRVYAPGIMQLRPVADRLGLLLFVSKNGGKNNPRRYFFCEVGDKVRIREIESRND